MLSLQAGFAGAQHRGLMLKPFALPVDASTAAATPSGLPSWARSLLPGASTPSSVAAFSNELRKDGQIERAKCGNAKRDRPSRKCFAINLYRFVLQIAFSRSAI